MDNRELETAIALMRMALALLDRSSHERAPVAACRLQAAIDGAEGVKPMRGGEALDPELKDCLLGRG